MHPSASDRNAYKFFGKPFAACTQCEQYAVRQYNATEYLDKRDHSLVTHILATLAGLGLIALLAVALFIGVV